MTPSAWDTAFLETTRGHIVTILRRGPKTVLELSDELGLAANTVRTHLGNLTQTGMVQRAGTRRGSGAGKPAHLFELTPNTETKFSRAYIPLLQTLIQMLTHRMGREEFEALMNDAGVQLAPESDTTTQTTPERLVIARTILESLGGVITSAQANGSMRIEGAGCPLAAIVTGNPEVCRVVQSLLSTALGVEVRAVCEHHGRPACRFVAPRGATP